MARELIEGRPALLVIEDVYSAMLCPPGLLAMCREHHVPVITSLGPPPGQNPGAGRLPGEASERLRHPSAQPDGTAPRLHEYLSYRPRSSAFFATNLDVLLRELGTQTLLIAGGQTNVSVHYTFLDAHQHDYFCRVAVDSMSGSSPQAHEAALAAMEYMQTGARRSSAEIIAALGSV